MTRFLAPLLAAVAALGTSPAMAQQAEGYWTGTLALSSEVELRVGVDIARGAGGDLDGTLDSPDQNAFDLPLESVTLDGDTLGFVVTPIGARYEARWDAGAMGWRGTFIQAGQAWPLVLVRGPAAERPRPVALPADWDVPGDAELGALLDTRLAGRPGAGLVLGVLEPEGTRLVARGPAQGGAPFDGGTLFEIGSITKVFTAILLADMTLTGEVALDDPVEDYLPEGATMPRRGGRQITLRDLSRHVSGLPRLPANMPYGDPQDPYADYTEAMMLDFLAGYQLPRDIGASFEYSNLGVGLLGYALARRAGTDYADLVRQRILAPLGMDDTGIMLTAEQQRRLAPPHDEYMRPASPWRIPALAGAGALRSSARDMLLFARAALDPQSPIGPAMALSVEGYDPGAALSGALGWVVAEAPSGRVLMHGGGTGGYRAHLALQPATGRAVVALTNAAVEPSVADLALHALTGAPVANAIPVPPAPPAAPPREEIALAPAQYDRLVGRYRLAPGITMDVARTAAGLKAQITGQPAFSIHPSAPLEFFWRVVEARVRFVEEAGAITGAILFQNGGEIPMEKTQ